MFDFLLGAAIIALPPHQQIPLAIGTAVLKGVQNFRRKNRAKRVASSLIVNDEVVLSWSNLSCTLDEKNGSERILLDDLNGAALPGRLLAICGPSGSGKTFIKDFFVLQFFPSFITSQHSSFIA